MDANGTRFHLLLGKDDWATCTGDNTGWDDKRNELTLAPRLFRFQIPAQHTDPVVENRRGAARDRYGNWYWIDATRTEVLVNSSGTAQTTHFWSSADGAAPAKHGDFGEAVAPPAAAAQTFGALSITDHHYLVVGVLDPAGLLIFDLHGGGPPQQVAWPKSAPFAPFDMAPAPGGGLWIFDRDNRRLWALDRLFNVLGDTPEPDSRREAFQPADGSGTRAASSKTFPGGIPLPVLYPVALAALPDNTVLILETDPSQNFSRIFRFCFRQQVGAPVSSGAALTLIDAAQQAGFRLPGYDMAYVAQQDLGGVTRYDVLYVTAANGDQSYAFRIALQGDQMSLQALPLYFPMRLFAGKGIVASGNRVYYDSRDQWVPLVAQRRPLYAPDAVLVTRVFDGKEPDCVWHRLMLDANIPPDTAVMISSRAANQKAQLDLTGWQPEPEFYLRGNGSEQPWVAQARGADAGTWELLFQRAKGRYLQLRIELAGDGRSTPRLRALRAYYPRFSYLKNYLPAVYRADADSASFLDRFLANAEGLYTGIEDRIALAEVLFEVNNAPPETLGWLAGWFGVALDPVWDESTQRLFLRHAMDFFQYRGTMRGLGMALRLVLESCAGEDIFDPDAKPRPGGIRLVEQFRTRRTPGVVLGDPGVANGIPLTLQSTRWLPSQGAAQLNGRYGGPYPISAPSDAAQAAAWKQFSLNTLGFLPRIADSEGTFWTDFLTRRYRQISKLNAAWLTAYASFDEIAQFAALPAKAAQLRDWFQFQGVVLPGRDNAHRFTVLLPVPESEALDPAAQQRRMELAKRVIDLEKPAHTIYDLKFYWAFFRVGEARLGEDSVLDYGSRAPRLLPPMVLGTGFIASSYLAPGYPQNLTDRQILNNSQRSILHE
jgi:phage tail-like protein